MDIASLMYGGVAVAYAVATVPLWRQAWGTRRERHARVIPFPHLRAREPMRPARVARAR